MKISFEYFNIRSIIAKWKTMWCVFVWTSLCAMIMLYITEIIFLGVGLCKTHDDALLYVNFVGKKMSNVFSNFCMLWRQILFSVNSWIGWLHGNTEFVCSLCISNFTFLLQLMTPLSKLIILTLSLAVAQHLVKRTFFDL